MWKPPGCSYSGWGGFRFPLKLRFERKSVIYNSVSRKNESLLCLICGHSFFREPSKSPSQMVKFGLPLYCRLLPEITDGCSRDHQTDWRLAEPGDGLFIFDFAHRAKSAIAVRQTLGLFRLVQLDEFLSRLRLPHILIHRHF